jgi:hypothetical protein
MTVEKLALTAVSEHPADGRIRWRMGSMRLALLTLIAAWSISRIYLLVCLQPQMCSEIWHVQKFREYGVLKRHGAAMLHPGFETGILPNPDAFNRTHHPFPILWFYTLLDVMFGQWGIVAFALALKLATCILLFLALDRYFSRFSAWSATLLYCLAPCALQLDNEAVNTTQLSAILMPLGVVLLAAGKTSNGKVSQWTWSRFAPWCLGLSVFLAGQMDWFPLTLVPALLVLAADWDKLRNGNVVAPFKNRACAQIFAGTILTVLVFAVQIVAYESDPHGLRSHLVMEASATSNTAIPRSALLFKFIPLRSVLFVGLPLLLGLAVGLIPWRKGLGETGSARPSPVRNGRPLRSAALACLGGYLLTALVIPMYFLREISPYTYMLFPAAVFSAAAIQRFPRFLPWLLLVLSVPGVAEMYLYASVPKMSLTSQAVARLLVNNSAKTDAVATNLEPGRPPYKLSDVMAGQATRYAADRLTQFGIQRREQLADLPGQLKRTEGPLVFILDSSRPFQPDLREALRGKGFLLNTNSLDLPGDSMNLAERARSFFYYKVMRKGKGDAQTPAAGQPAATEQIEVYKLNLRDVPLPGQ